MPPTFNTSYSLLPTVQKSKANKTQKFHDKTPA